MRILTAFALTLCFACAALAQTGGTQTAGVNLATQSNVFGSVTAQAVLIPAKDARRIFGKEIGDRYAVIEVNVGNKSPDAALVVHNIFIDYKRWTLSGARPDAAGIAVESETLSGRFGGYQSSSFPNQIASEEYRVVRGQFLNALQWKPRNKFLRLAVLAGNIAAAYSFSINELGFNKGISAFNGVVVPGMNTAWPDTHLEQLNLINDLGFRTGRRVPKESADVIVCFFPIDRFLTPGFADLFRKSPALFFAPVQMIVDRKLEKDVARVLGKDLGLAPEDVGAEDGESTLAALRRQLPCYLRVMKHVGAKFKGPDDSTPLGNIYSLSGDTCLRGFGLVEVETPDKKKRIQFIDDKPETKAKLAGFMALDYIADVSLNNVVVTIDGALSVDTTAIAARIADVQFDPVSADCGPDTQCFWADKNAGGGLRTGTIRGAYLTGGSVSIKETDVGLEEFKTLEGGNDQRLRFTFKVTDVVQPGTALHFKVSKPKGGNEEVLESEEFGYRVPAPAFGSPEIVKAELDKDTLTITGSGFFDDALAVELLTPGGETLKGDDLTFTSKETKKLVLDIPADKKAPGCWEVNVAVGDPERRAPRAVEFAVLPSPKLETAEVKNGQIVLKGEELRDTKDCGGKELKFQLEKETMTDQDKAIDLASTSTAVDSWVLRLPPAAASGKWFVQMWLDGKKVGSRKELTRP